MNITPINNINFNARIKIKKPEKLKIMQGVASSLLGTGIGISGLDLFRVEPFDLNVTEKSLNELYSVPKVKNNEGIYEYVPNDSVDSAISGSILYSIPSGIFSIALGAEKIVDVFDKKRKNPS